MKNDFEILAQFLENMSPEVSGRSGMNLSPEQEELIRKFADGTLNAEAREELMPALLENEKALRELVHVIQSQNG